MLFINALLTFYCKCFFTRWYPPCDSQKKSFVKMVTQLVLRPNFFATKKKICNPKALPCMGYELKQLNDFQSADMCRNAIFLYVHTCLAQSTSTGSVNKQNLYLLQPSVLLSYPVFCNSLGCNLDVLPWVLHCDMQCLFGDVWNCFSACFLVDPSLSQSSSAPSFSFLLASSWNTCLLFFLCSPDLLLFLHRNLLTPSILPKCFHLLHPNQYLLGKPWPLPFFTTLVFLPSWNLVLFFEQGLKLQKLCILQLEHTKIQSFDSENLVKTLALNPEKLSGDCSAGTRGLGLQSLFCKILCQICIPPEGLLDEGTSACAEEAPEAAAGGRLYGTNCNCSSDPACVECSP